MSRITKSRVDKLGVRRVYNIPWILVNSVRCVVVELAHGWSVGFRGYNAHAQLQGITAS